MEQFQKLIPENFRELFSFIAFFISLIFIFISLSQRKYESCSRMAAILFIVSLSLFANNEFCYFGAIFIIATAVTQLDFLQNLAAIIRGSKEYFDYKKESKPFKEVENSLERESEIIENTTVEEDIKDLVKESNTINLAIDKQKLSLGQVAFITEEYTFKFLEQKFQKPIQRYVRIFSKKFFRVEFDGILTFGDTDIIFEIKTTRRGVFPTSIIKQSILRILGRIQEYKEITKRNAALRLVLIGNFDNDYKTTLLSKIPELVPETKGIEITIDFYSFSDIGLDINNIE
jgi:hypothetical protein